MERIVYSDFDVNLGMHPLTQDLIVKTNEQSIRQSLRLILKTRFYDRKWQPDVGSEITDLLFEQLDSFTLFAAEEAIRDVITKFEPRIELEEVKCYVDEEKTYLVNVRIVYHILLLNKTDMFIYTINRIR